MDIRRREIFGRRADTAHARRARADHSRERLDDGASDSFARPVERTGERPRRVSAVQAHDQCETRRVLELSGQRRHTRALGIPLSPAVPHGGWHVSHGDCVMNRTGLVLLRSLSASPNGRAAFLRVVGIAALVVTLSAGLAQAQAPHPGGHPPGGSTTIFGQPGSPIPIEPPPASAADVSPSPVPYGGNPVEDTMLIWHVLFSQLEGRTNGPDTGLRWDGEAWVGTDYNRVWFKSEGFFNEHGKVEDGDHEVLYDRPIPFLRYFDWQAGLRYDWDAAAGRLWGAFGIEGLAPGFFDVEATFYVRDASYFAGRVQSSYDLLLTNLLIAQPWMELNFASKT